jgi:hypothetical protein
MVTFCGWSWRYPPTDVVDLSTREKSNAVFCDGVGRLLAHRGFSLPGGGGLGVLIPLVGMHLLVELGHVEGALLQLVRRRV